MSKGANFGGRLLVTKFASPCDDSHYLGLTDRYSHYGNWDDISMIKAMTAVEGGMSIRRASEEYGVPKSTLYDRVSGRVQHGCRPGPAGYLTVEEEEELAHFLLRCAEIGYPHTLAQVLAIVQQVVSYKGIDKVVTQGWWNRFCQRHKEVSLRTAVPLSRVRAMATDSSTIDRYFCILEETLKDNGIFNNPSRIYNCDETGMPLSSSVAKGGHAGGSCPP